MDEKLNVAMEKMKTAQSLRDEALETFAAILNEIADKVTILNSDDTDFKIYKFYSNGENLLFETIYADD